MTVEALCTILNRKAGPGQRVEVWDEAGGSWQPAKVVWVGGAWKVIPEYHTVPREVKET